MEERTMMEPIDIQRAKPDMLSNATHARVIANNAVLTTPADFEVRMNRYLAGRKGWEIVSDAIREDA